MGKNKKNRYLLSEDKIRFINKLFVIIIIFIFVISLIWYFKVNLYFTDKYYWYYTFGVEYSSLGNYDKAIEYFNKSIKLDKDRPEAYMERVRVYTSLGVLGQPQMIKNAERELVLLKDRNWSENFFLSMGWNSLHQNNMNESMYYFKKGIEKDPTFSDNYIGLGHAYLKIGNLEEAFENLNQSKALIREKYEIRSMQDQMRLSRIHAGLGFVYQKQGLNAKAEEEFQIANSLDPFSIEIVSNLIS